jgi:hypothetical protein
VAPSSSASGVLITGTVGAEFLGLASVVGGVVDLL